MESSTSNKNHSTPTKSLPQKKNPYVIIGTIIAGIITIAVIIFVIFFVVQKPADQAAGPDSAPTESTEKFDYSWAENNPYIAHAFGGILGDTYTNSYEAFLLNYQLGHRVFEVDFYITDDGKTVAAHDNDYWSKNATLPANLHTSGIDDATKEFTYDNFMSSLWYDKYHPIDLDTLIQILKEYPDVYIVTDTKYSDT